MLQALNHHDISAPQQSNCCTLLASIFATYVNEFGITATLAQKDAGTHAQLIRDLTAAQTGFLLSENLEGYTPKEAADAFKNSDHEATTSFSVQQQLNIERTSQAGEYYELVEDVIKYLNSTEPLDEESKRVLQEGLLDRVTYILMPDDYCDLITQKLFSGEEFTADEIEKLRNYQAQDKKSDLAEQLRQVITGSACLISQNGHTIVFGQDTHEPKAYYYFDSASGQLHESQDINHVVAELTEKINTTPGAIEITELAFTKDPNAPQPQHHNLPVKPNYFNGYTQLGLGLMFISTLIWLCCPPASLATIAFNIMSLEISYSTLNTLSFAAGACLTLYGFFGHPATVNEPDTAHAGNNPKLV